jgi:hypothetical protein
MKKEIMKYHGEREGFVATFTKYVIVKPFKGLGKPIVKLHFKQVKLKGHIVASTLVFAQSKVFAGFKFQPGDTVSFEARVKRIEKKLKSGELNLSGEMDYKLSHPTNVTRIQTPTLF